MAVVGGTPITVTTLNHWVATFIRGDYYATIGKRAPHGLASDPPNYPACATAASTVTPRASNGQPRLSHERLTGLCKQLYRSVRLEALSYLISVLWAVGESAEAGEHVSEQEVSQKLAQVKAEQYPRRGQFEEYLTNKGWSIADMRFILKRNILAARLLARNHVRPADESRLVKLVVHRKKVWTARTSCRAGFVVWQCKQYSASQQATLTSPSTLFGEMTGRA